MLIEAPTPHRPETSFAFSLKACEYRNLALGQCKRPFELGVSFRLTCLGLFLQRRVSRVAPCILHTPRLHLPRALPHPRRE